jgi:hypothetical protein
MIAAGREALLLHRSPIRTRPHHAASPYPRTAHERHSVTHRPTVPAGDCHRRVAIKVCASESREAEAGLDL